MASVGLQGADKRTSDDPAMEILELWNFGRPVHSILGSSCSLEQVS